jgi:aspartate aminotransferase-like enzyme
MMVEEGREAVYARHARIGQLTRDGVKAMGLSLLADERFASNTVTAVTMPEGEDPDAFRKLMNKEYDVILQGGQADLTGKIFRIGHLGWVHDEDLQECLDLMRQALPKFRNAVPAAV